MPYFKIGRSKDPEARLSQIKTDSPFPLFIWKTWPVEPAEVCQAEKAAHDAMQKYNRALDYPETAWQTEWFGLKDGLTMEDVEQRLSLVLEKYKPGPKKI